MSLDEINGIIGEVREENRGCLLNQIYAVTLTAKENVYEGFLGTVNAKDFPKNTFVVSPAEMVQIVEGNISGYEELEKARAKLQLMSELQKGRLSGENAGWISEEEIKK